jgi:hypothetical protein
MRPLEVYSQVLVTFAPEPRKLRLAAALAVYRHRLYKLFHMAFHRKRILSGPYIPEGWSNADHGLETIYLMKRPHASDGKNRNGKRPFQPSTGLSHGNSDTGEICRR